MPSPPPNERSDNGSNDNGNDQRSINNTDTLSTANPSSNNQHYSTASPNQGESPTHSLRDAGPAVGVSVTAETTAGAERSDGNNSTTSDPVDSSYHVEATSSSETSGTTAANGWAATNPEAMANGALNRGLSSNPHIHPSFSAPGRARNANGNFVFTYRDGHLTPVPIGARGLPSDASPPNPTEADGNGPDAQEHEEVARIVSTLLSGFGLPINLQASSASPFTGPQGAETAQANPQPPSALNATPMDPLDQSPMTPSDTRASGDQHRDPAGVPSGGVLVSLSFDIGRQPIPRRSTANPNASAPHPFMLPSLAPHMNLPNPHLRPHSPSLLASRPQSSSSERQGGTDRDADLEAFRRSMADARANGRDINWREAMRTSRESSRPPSAQRQSSDSSEPAVRPISETPILSPSGSNTSNLANPSISPPNVNINQSLNPPDVLGGQPRSFFDPLPIPAGAGGPGIGGFWLPGDSPGLPFPFLAPFFVPDFLSGEKPPDKRRARELLRGLKIAPKGLIKRLEEVERVRSVQPSSVKSKEGAENINDGQGKLLCAVCWEPLLPTDDSSEDDEHHAHTQDGDRAPMEVDEGTVTDGDADYEMDIDEEDAEIPADSGAANPKTKTSKNHRPPPWSNQLIVLPCTHVFHAECLEPWFTTSKTTCPTCRFDVDPESLTLDMGRLFGGPRRARGANAAGAPSGSPAGAAAAAGTEGSNDSNRDGAGNGNNAEAGNENGGFGLLRSIFSSVMARAVANAASVDDPQALLPAEGPATSGNDYNHAHPHRISEDDIPPPSTRPRPHSYPGVAGATSAHGIPRPVTNATDPNDNESVMDVPIVIIDEDAPGGSPLVDDPEVLGSVNQILSSLFGAAAMAGTQPSSSAPRPQFSGPTGFDPSSTNAPNPSIANSASTPRSHSVTNAAEPASSSSLPPFSMFSNMAFPSGPQTPQTPQTPSTMTASPSWGYGFHRTYTTGPGIGLGGLGLGSPSFGPRSLSPSSSTSGRNDAASSMPSSTSVPSGSLPSGMNTPTSAFSGSPSSRLGMGPRPSTPTSSARHHPYAHARPHTPNISSPSGGAEAPNHSPNNNHSRPNSDGGSSNRAPEFTITHHTITFSWGMPGDTPMRDGQANGNPIGPSNDNNGQTSNPQNPPSGNGSNGPSPLDAQTPFRTIFQSAWTGSRSMFPREPGTGGFGGFVPVPGFGGAGGIGATRTTPGSNTNSTRPRRKWVAPEGSSLRSVVEAREREVGLRCEDVSCLWGPEDDDDPEDRKTVRMERVFLKKRTEGSGAPTSTCTHRFHPECLLVSTRISEPMIDNEMGEGTEHEAIEVSCPRCRTRGAMEKAEWRHCKQLAESV